MKNFFSPLLSFLTRFSFISFRALLFTAVCCSCVITAANAQQMDSVSYEKYKFIDLSKNKIENDSSALSSFYQNLLLLEEKKNKRVNITHIGDSHIQADIFSGTIRQHLQLKFGNAGRGLIFPYRVAKSNEPGSYKTTSGTKWDAKRNVFYDKPLPIGISGFTIETNDSSAEIDLAVKNQPGLDYSFTKFTLFHERGLSNYDITICDSINCEQGIFKSSDKSNNPFVSELKFEKPMRQIILRNKNTDTAHQHSTRIYGMLLENDSAGVLYNMIGVNGAEYRHYTKSKYFMEQLTYLQSSLVIISMGTNEGFNKGFDKDLFYKQIDSLVLAIRITNPSASVILTTPGDSFRKSRKGRVKNPDIKLVEATIITYCKNNNLAYWDLYEIMGGYGSMAKWYTAKLSAADRVHFNGNGYKLQANLFYDALMSGYEKYRKNKS